MSYTFLQDQGAASSAECFSDIPAYVLSKLIHTAEASCFKDKETESCLDFHYGTMLERLTQDHGKNTSMSCAVDFHAPTSVRPEQTAEQTENILESTAIAADCGEKWRESLAKYGLDLRLLKTPRIYALGALSKSFKHLTQWGITRRGVAFDLATLARTTNASECLSLLPTPTRHNAKEGAYPAEYKRKTPTLAAQIGGKVNPDWSEARMGWPIRWTDLRPLEMDKMRTWLNSHGKR